MHESGTETDTATAEAADSDARSRRQLLRSIGSVSLMGALGGGVTAVRADDSDYELPDGLPADFVEDERFSEQYGPKMIRAPEAWTTTLGSDDVTIGVIDSGVDHQHPDLADQYGPNYGYDFVDNDENPDEEGIRVHWDYEYGEHNDWDTTLEAHGTAVSGIAAATTGNGTGISGISNARLLTARVSGGADISGGTIDGTNDRIDITNVHNAVEYLDGLGVDIINFSASIPRDVVDADPDLAARIDEIVDFAEENDVLFVAAAGNQGNEFDGVNVPGTRDEVLCVGGVSKPPVDETDWWDLDPTAWGLDLWEADTGARSQSGPSVDVVAPAEDVLTTWPSGRNHWLLPDDHYGTAVATSMAAPAVTGVAALVLSQNPDLSAPELRDLLRSSARDVGLAASEQGAGLVDAKRAVEMA